MLVGYSTYRVLAVELRGGKPLFRENDAGIPADAEKYRAFVDEILASSQIAREERLAIANAYRYNTPLLFARDVAVQRWRRPIELDWEAPMVEVPQSPLLASCGPELDAAISRDARLRKVTVSRGCSLWRRAASDLVG